MPSAPAARPDTAACVLLFTAVVVYLAAMPRNLGVADESYFLLEAKRVAAGEVLYRNIFCFVAPGAHWLMALLFGCFGVSMAVARLAMAVLHGATAVAIVLTCRAIGVRLGLALAAGVAHVALCQSVWPYASNHWLATFLTVLLLLVVVRGRRWPAPARRAFVPGLIVGALTAVRQQSGAAMALGLVVFFLLDGLSGISYRQDRSLATAVRRVAYSMAGIAVVVLPLAAGLLLSIGFTPLYQQWVEFPLENHRRYHPYVAWAGLSPLSLGWVPYTFLPFLAHLRVVVGIDVLRAAVHWIRRADRDTLQPLLALATLCSAAALSVAYFPDFIHVAYVAAPFLVALAETIEAIVRTLEVAIRRPRVLGWVLATAALVALGVHLYRNLVRARAEFPIAAETAFGHVDFATQSEANIIIRVSDAMRDAPRREFFAYPVWTSLYLTADVDNPTRFPALVPGYNSPEQFAEAIAALEAKPPAYLLNCPFVSPPDDPIVEYIRQHYENFAPGPGFCRLYRRRAAPSGPSR